MDKAKSTLASEVDPATCYLTGLLEPVWRWAVILGVETWLPVGLKTSDVNQKALISRFYTGNRPAWLATATRLAAGGHPLDAPRKGKIPDALKSPFAGICGERDLWMDAVPLSLEYGFIPLSEQPGKEAIAGLVRDFFTHLHDGAPKSTADLLVLMERYLNAVPVPGDRQMELCTYDYARLCAAIAEIAGERQLVNGGKPTLNHAPFCTLVKGDLSGIQRFIFNVKSEGAAKTLKARSFYIQAQAELLVTLFQRELGLRDANMLYNGGGNFYFLAPLYGEEGRGIEARLAKVKKQVDDSWLSIGLQLYTGFEILSLDDLTKLGEAWSRMEDNLQVSRLQPYKEQDWDTLFKAHHPPVLAESLDRVKNYLLFEQDRDFDAVPDQWSVLTDQLNQAEGAWIAANSPRETEIDPKAEITTSIVLDDLHWGFWNGVGVPDWLEGSRGTALRFNTRVDQEAFRKAPLRENRFLTYKLPAWNAERREKYHITLERLRDACQSPEEDEQLNVMLGNNAIIGFDLLGAFSETRTGSKFLGILKLDVDNLGKVFQEGLVKSRDHLATRAMLSRAMKWFFEGHLNTLLEEAGVRDEIYPVFAGGDDCFLIGAWDKIFPLAAIIREAFGKLTGGNPHVTLSAGLVLVKPSFPVQQVANLAEDALEEAKQFGRGGGNNQSEENRAGNKKRQAVRAQAPWESWPQKDRLTVFGEVLNWAEWDRAGKIMGYLMQLIGEFQQPRAIIWKVMHSVHGFAGLQRNAARGAIRFHRVWQFQYAFREIRGGDLNGTYINKQVVRDFVEGTLIAEYESLIREALLSEAQTNTALFAVGARWADLLTRKKI